MNFVIYHNNCPDGFGSAFAAWKKFEDDCKYIPANHGDKFPSIPDGSNVYICDFSYPRDVLVEQSKRLNLKVIDHHKTAQEALQGLDFAIFDMNKSGAVLTWEFFHDAAVPELLLHIQDRDIWKWELPDSDEILLGLDLKGYDFETWDNVDISQLKKDGEILAIARDKEVNEMLKKVYPKSISGHYGLVANVANKGIISHLGNKVCEENPDVYFFGGYHFTERDGVLTQEWSLRSVGDNDCSLIAKEFGGGGHKNACGFAVTDFIL